MREYFDEMGETELVTLNGEGVASAVAGGLAGATVGTWAGMGCPLP